MFNDPDEGWVQGIIISSRFGSDTGVIKITKKIEKNFIKYTEYMNSANEYQRGDIDKRFNEMKREKRQIHFERDKESGIVILKIPSSRPARIQRDANSGSEDDDDDESEIDYCEGTIKKADGTKAKKDQDEGG